MDLSCFDRRWFALQVRPRYELFVENVLHNKGFEGFAPTYKSARQWSDRKKVVARPLFPGYVFCRFNAEIKTPILSTPGIVRVVGGNSSIDDSEIEAIRSVVAKGIATNPCSYLEIGTKALVVSGPLTGLTGILTGHTNQHRLILSVTVVRNSISVQIEPGDVVAVRPNNRVKAAVLERVV
jgi:transcriptional antiterminator NusG